MLSIEGFVQTYNAQAAVDVDSHLIVENHITQQANDKQQIEPALERVSGVAGSRGKPEGLLADAGYFSGKEILAFENDHIKPVVPKPQT